MSETTNDEYVTDAEVGDVKAEYTETACEAIVKALSPALDPAVDPTWGWGDLDPDGQNAVRVAMLGILDGWEELLRADFRATQPPAERVLGFQPPR